MTLVLSMNTFCDHAASAGDCEIPEFPSHWESQRCSKSCISSPVPLECAAEQLAGESYYRRGPDPVATSRIAYFKRKYVEDEDSHPGLHNCCQRVTPAFEERAHVLRVSLDKLRFIEDPEAFLRRSVLVNNLLRRLRAEILLQSDWCFTPPSSASSPSASHCPWENPATRACFTSVLPVEGHYRKRFRVRRGEEECFERCCCFYGGRYLRLPYSVCDEAPSSSSSSSSSFSSSPLIPQLLPLEDGAKLHAFYPCFNLPGPRKLTGEKEEPKQDRTCTSGGEPEMTKILDVQQEEAGICYGTTGQSS
ncbi:SERTA domain-containing protein 4 [Huso huso]|uniref:SERTA domain-containing protein 4 n=1 Tax=Huso huso TaxID=61971 RepID=A0ABR0ZX72_HUSHU